MFSQIMNFLFVIVYSRKKFVSDKKVAVTGKYLSEALILASTNPQYDDRLFIEQVQ